MRLLSRTAFTLLLISSSSHGAEWLIDPTLRLRAGYNDNYRLNTSNEISTAEAVFSPGVRFSVNTPRSGASGEAKFDFRRVEEDSNLDDDNYRFFLDSYYNLERSRVGLDASLIKDTTLDSQLEETGLVFQRKRRQRLNISPNWTYRFNPRTSLSASYRYSDVQYKNPGDSGLTDFTLNTARTSLSRILSERANASITLSRTRSENDNDVTTTNTSFQGGGSYSFSETFSASAFLGVRKTEAEFSSTTLIPIFSGDTVIGFIPLNEDATNSDWGTTYSVSVTKSYERGEATALVSQDIRDDANGLPFEVTRLRSSASYRLSNTLSTALNFTVSHTESRDTAGFSLDRDYYQVTPEIAWKFKEFWSLTANYRYRKQTFDNTDDDATQNAAYLTLTYLWPRIAVSR